MSPLPKPPTPRTAELALKSAISLGDECTAEFLLEGKQITDTGLINYTLFNSPYSTTTNFIKLLLRYEMSPLIVQERDIYAYNDDHTQHINLKDRDSLGIVLGLQTLKSKVPGAAEMLAQSKLLIREAIVKRGGGKNAGGEGQSR